VGATGDAAGGLFAAGATATRLEVSDQRLKPVTPSAITTSAPAATRIHERRGVVAVCALGVVVAERRSAAGVTVVRVAATN
jgi:hypothetical protein